MKKKKLIIIIAVVVLVVCVCTGLVLSKKNYLDSHTNYLNDENYKTIIERISSLEVTTDKSLANAEYEGVKFYLPDGLEKDDNIQGTVLYLDDKDNLILRVFKGETWFDYATNDEEIKLDVRTLKKYGIEHDLDFIEYAKNRIGKESNIFTSKARLDVDYIASLYIQNRFMRTNEGGINFKILSGDLKGTAYSLRDQAYIIGVYNGNDYYEIWLNHITEEEQAKILSSIYFE